MAVKMQLKWKTKILLWHKPITPKFVSDDNISCGRKPVVDSFTKHNKNAVTCFRVLKIVILLLHQELVEYLSQLTDFLLTYFMCGNKDSMT